MRSHYHLHSIQTSMGQTKVPFRIFKKAENYFSPTLPILYHLSLIILTTPQDESDDDYFASPHGLSSHNYAEEYAADSDDPGRELVPHTTAAANPFDQHLTASHLTEPATTRENFVKGAHQISLLKIETLSKTKSQCLMSGLYLVILTCTVVSTIDYLLMWECTNICGYRGLSTESGNCGEPSASCMTINDKELGFDYAVDDYGLPYIPQAPAQLPALQNRLSEVALIEEDLTDIQNETSYEVTWNGHITGLTSLNRFLHMTFKMDNPMQSNKSVFEITNLQLRQVVYRNRDEAPYNVTMFLTLSCAFRQVRCSTLQVPVSSMPWSRVYNMSISLVNPPEAFRPYVHTASVVFQYQKSSYTTAEIVLRMLMLLFTIWNMRNFYLKLKKVSIRYWLTEQIYIFVLFIFLIIYLDPFYMLATYENPGSEHNGLWSLIIFLEFHASTYFLLYSQVLVVVLLTAVRRRDGHVKKETHFVVLTWLAFMMAFDIYVAETDIKHGDYSSTFFWFLVTHSLSDLTPAEAAWVLCAIIAEAGWFFWTVRGIYRTKKKLKATPYFPTRHRQIAFRYIYFMFGGLLFYEIITAFISGFLNDGLTVTYRSTQELGAVILAFVFVHLIAYIYLPAFENANAPPAPCDPNWKNARWKSVKWLPEWYVWLSDHGGSLYFFVRKSEQDTYLEAQREEEDVDECTEESSAVPSDSASRKVHHAKGDSTNTTGSDLRAFDSTALSHTASSNNNNNTGNSNSRRRSRSLRFSLTGVVDTAGKVSQIPKMIVLQPFRFLHEALFSEGYKGCPRLFFCLEICCEMLNMSYAAYDQVDTTFLIAQYQGEGTQLGSFTREVCERLEAVSLTIHTLAAAILVNTHIHHDELNRASPETEIDDTDEDNTEIPGCPSTVKPATRLQRVSAAMKKGASCLPGFRRNVDDDESLPGKSETSDTDPTPSVCQFGYEVFDVIDGGTMVTIISTHGTGRNRHVVVAFRGTWNKSNAINDLKVYKTTWNEMDEAVDGDSPTFSCGTNLPLLHSGFQEVWGEVKDKVKWSIIEVLETFDFRPTVYITGHSLGGAVACLCAYSVTVELGLLPVVYTFGCPKMGNKAFQRRYVTKTKC